MNIRFIDYKVTVYRSDYNIQIDIIDNDSFDKYEFANLRIEYENFYTGYSIKSNKNNYKKVLKILKVGPKAIKEIVNNLIEFDEDSVYVTIN
jgi:hypothetical protein